jgi:hypothetical protein
MHKATLLALLLSSMVAGSAHARAPDTFEEEYAAPIEIASPMWFAFELKLGPFRPNFPGFKKLFQDDRGWLLSTELDVTAWHIPYVGQLNAGFGWGWANYDAKAIEQPGGGRVGEEAEYTTYPMSALAVLRIDALARYTIIPITFAAKLGVDMVRWKMKKGGEAQDDGLNFGLRWGAQAAIELDMIDRKATRRLDDDFGINHTFLLFEYYGSETESAGGRAFQFGIGLQF